MTAFNPGDLLLVQNEIVFTREIMEMAKEQGLKIHLNPSPYNQKIKELPLELADILFVKVIHKV
jgi:ribokinase